MLSRKCYPVIWALLVWGLCGACQKVELPSEEDSEQSGSGGEHPGGKPSDGEETPLPPGYIEAFSVADVLKTYGGVDLESDYEAGVVGYIVGSCTGTTMSSALFSTEGASASNLLIADAKGETDIERCLPVELKKGSEVREGLNLAAHPENMGKRVFVYGLVKSYFRVVGLKSTALYEWIADEGGQPENPEEKPNPGEPENPDPEEPEQPENPDPEQPEEPELPVPDKNDTIIIDDNPIVVPGGRSI